MKKKQNRVRDNQKLREKHRALRKELPEHGELNLPNWDFSVEQIMADQYGIKTRGLNDDNDSV